MCVRGRDIVAAMTTSTAALRCFLVFKSLTEDRPTKCVERVDRNFFRWDWENVMVAYEICCFEIFPLFLLGLLNLLK